jgi:DNA-binding CsgD family transcriptional regulator
LRTSDAPASALLRGLRVAVWGRNELYACSLGALLESRGARVRLLEDASSLRSTGAQGKPRVVLAESPFPRDLRDLHITGAPVIVLSDHPERRDLEEDSILGVTSAIAKNATMAELVLTIARALEEPSPEPDGLTARQLEVLELLARGLDNRQIASQLGISRRTAKAHVSALLERLGVENRTQAAVTAVRRGLVSSEQ